MAEQLYKVVNEEDGTAVVVASDTCSEGVVYRVCMIDDDSGSVIARQRLAVKTLDEAVAYAHKLCGVPNNESA